MNLHYCFYVALSGSGRVKKAGFVVDSKSMIGSHRFHFTSYRCIVTQETAIYVATIVSCIGLTHACRWVSIDISCKNT